jgi:hypothetical protein
MSVFPTSSNFLAVLKNWSPKLSGLSDIMEEFIGSFFWQDWEPTVKAGTMTIVVQDQFKFRYLKVRSTVWVIGYCIFTTGGTGTNAVRFSAPFPAKDNDLAQFSAGVRDASSGLVQIGYGFLNGDDILIRKSDASNWTTGTDRVARFSGFYEAA